MEPHGPRLAESSTSKSIIFFSFFLNQSHLSWPRASAVGRSSADFANPEKIEMKALMDTPSFHCGSCLPSTLSSTTKMMSMQIKLKTQLNISISHHSMNQAVNQLRARSVLETCHEKRDLLVSLSNRLGYGRGVLPREYSVEKSLINGVPYEPLLLAGGGVHAPYSCLGVFEVFELGGELDVTEFEVTEGMGLMAPSSSVDAVEFRTDWKEVAEVRMDSVPCDMRGDIVRCCGCSDICGEG
jgi:hypothetical protein